MTATMTATDYRQAVCAWRELLGPGYILTDGATLTAAATATYPTAARPAAVLRPATREEARGCVLIAGRHGQVLHPISAGRNWGYGSRVPPAAGVILLDLSRLDRILDFDPELGYLTVEPGVTFRQALDFLRERGGGWTFDTTGGPLAGSLIGNLAERGLGIGPQVDRWDHACDLEVLLGDGTTIRTGYGIWPDAVAAPVGRRGPGPDLAGLFSQSGWGIVTQATCWLLPLPAHAAVARLSLADPARLPALIDAVRRLRATCPNVDTARFYNDAKVLAARRIYPLALAGAEGYLPPGRVRALARAVGLDPWQGMIGVRATSAAQLALLRDEIARALTAPGARCDWLDASVLPDPQSRQWAGAADLDGAIDSAYWKMPHPPGATPDLDRDGCGALWCAPALPFTGQHAARVVAIAERVCAAYRFEPVLTLGATSPRLLIGTVVLTWDRSSVGADDRALACHAALLQQFAAAGYYPYRLGRVGAPELAPLDPATAALRRRLAAACDPTGVLAHLPLADAATAYQEGLDR